MWYNLDNIRENLDDIYIIKIKEKNNMYSDKRLVIVGRKYFICKSVNVLSKLINLGFVPTEAQEVRDGHWFWIIPTTDELINALKDMFPDCNVTIVD